MKKIIALLCCAAALLSGCSANPLTKSPEPNLYKRISFKSETMGALDECISTDTVVINNTDEVFPTQLPIYAIKEHKISEEEFQQMLVNLEVAENSSDWSWCKLELDNNEINGTIAPFGDPERGYYDTLQLTDEELEELAWETFNKIPFLEGEYEYCGLAGNDTRWTMDSESEIVTRVGVAFRRKLDGMNIIQNDRCVLYFDGSGFVEMHLAMYDYQKIGTMDLVPVEEAEARITSPDDFTIDSTSDDVSELQADKVNMLWVNQFVDGCTILQPVYNFGGTATLKSGGQTDFHSVIIAIPESYTYEAE